MGASLIQTSERGASMQNAYRNAVEDAIDEYGNDTYNGTISTTSGFVDKTKEWKASGMDINSYAEWLYENDKLNKWGNAVGVCINEPITNTNKIKSQVNTTPQKGTRVWKTIYTAKTYDGTFIGESEYQIDAIKLARIYTEREKIKSIVVIEKKLQGSSNLVSEITYKKSDKERVGYYYFIALAAE